MTTTTMSPLANDIRTAIRFGDRTRADYDNIVRVHARMGRLSAGTVASYTAALVEVDLHAQLANVTAAEDTYDGWLTLARACETVEVMQADGRLSFEDALAWNARLRKGHGSGL